MRLKEKNLLQKFAATLKKFSAQGAKKVEYGNVGYLEQSGKNAVILMKSNVLLVFKNARNWKS